MSVSVPRHHHVHMLLAPRGLRPTVGSRPRVANCVLCIRSSSCRVVKDARPKLYITFLFQMAQLYRTFVAAFSGL